MKVVKWLNLKKKTKKLVSIILESPDLFQDFLYIFIFLNLKPMKTNFALFALVLAFLSCSKNKVYDDFDSNFDNNRWDASDVRVFEFDIAQSESFCELKLHFGHISGFQFKEVPLEVEITFPDGKSEVLPVTLKLIDESGNDIGDCTGDICDVFQTIKRFQYLEKGKYKVLVKSKFTGPYLPNVLGVGIIIERQK